MTKSTSVRIHDYHAEFLDEYNINTSAEVRDALDDLMRLHGVDIEQWKKTYGE